LLDPVFRRHCSADRHGKFLDGVLEGNVLLWVSMVDDHSYGEELSKVFQELHIVKVDCFFYDF